MLDSITKDKLLERKEWYLALDFWGDVLANATLLSICENLEEHIDYMLAVEDLDE
jgi:hypothetical protein